MDKVKIKVMSNAYKAVEQFFHGPSKTYIYYCRGLSHLGAKGVGAFPNESYENFQRNLTKMVEPATKKQLMKWDRILETDVKRAEMELRLKYLTSDDDGNKQVKVSVEDDLQKYYRKLEKNTCKKVFQKGFINLVNELWEKLPDGVYKAKGCGIDVQELVKVPKVRGHSSHRVSFSIPSQTIVKVKLIADEIDVKDTALTRSIANQAVLLKKTL